VSGGTLKETYHNGQLPAILEEATGISGKHTGGVVVSPSGLAYPPGVEVKFPEQVRAVDRVNMWLDGGNIRLGMWPAELKPQYECVYSDPKKVEALIALVNLPNWDIGANFHLAYWLATPAKRWYPKRQLSGPEYLLQCIDDFRDQRPGRRPGGDLGDTSFRQWLVARRYASESEVATLDAWRDALPREHFDIRPSVEVTRSWQLADAIARDRRNEFVTEVRAAIDRVLSALGEPELMPGPVATRETACPTCHMVHAGECL
jgi:hypothetical protein